MNNRLTMKEAAAKKLDAAEKLGGIDLRAHVERIGEHYGDCLAPIPSSRVLKFRGIGPKKILLLKKLGLVADPVCNEVQSSDLNGNTKFILEQCGIGNKEEAKSAIVLGNLKVKGHRNYGAKRHAEVCQWVGIPTSWGPPDRRGIILDGDFVDSITEPWRIMAGRLALACVSRSDVFRAKVLKEYSNMLNETEGAE